MIQVIFPRKGLLWKWKLPEDKNGYTIKPMAGYTNIPLPKHIECNGIPNSQAEMPPPSAFEANSCRSVNAGILLVLGRDQLWVHKYANNLMAFTTSHMPRRSTWVGLSYVMFSLAIHTNQQKWPIENVLSGQWVPSVLLWEPYQAQREFRLEKPEEHHLFSMHQTCLQNQSTVDESFLTAEDMPSCVLLATPIDETNERWYLLTFGMYHLQKHR